MSTLVVYHRGGGKSLGYPPNCIFTVKWALNHKAKAIEFDVTVAKDKIMEDSWKIIVVEPKLLTKNNLDIDNLEMKDIIALNAGNEKFGACKVATLKEILAIADYSKVSLQIHIKGTNPHTVQTLVSELKDSKLNYHELKDYGNILITSFDLRMLDSLKQLESRIKTGWIVKPDIQSGSEGASDLTAEITSNQSVLAHYTKQELADIEAKSGQYHIDVILLCAPKISNPETIKMFHRKGFEVGAWGVGTNLSMAKKLMGFEIDRFTMDNPEELNI